MGRKARIVLGLNSGTSADGVDAAACEIVGRGLGMRVRVLGHVARPYEPSLRHRLLAAMAPATTQTEEICLLEVLVGRAFAGAAEAARKKFGLQRVDLIGSHGQTICHRPPRGGPGRSQTPGATMQIGDPAVIAGRLRTPVVSGFRQADMAVGGQGAPLVPWTDYVLFHHPRRRRLIQNLGGISNITWLPAGGGPENVIAFDLGPGNLLIDALVCRFTRSREAFDRGGRRGEAGTENRRLLNAMLRHAFIAAPPPKSCGRDEFGEPWLRGLLRRFARPRIPPADWIRTAYAFFAFCCLCAYLHVRREAAPGRSPFDEIILCGGGARNRRLRHWVRTMARLSARSIRPVPMASTADFGIPIQAKEAVSFAMLAAACVDRVPANLPQVTGASRRVVLGQVCDPEPRR